MAIEKQEDIIDRMKGDCFNGALHAFGTAFIYSERSIKIGRWLKINNFLGIALPGLFWTLATLYNLTPINLNYILIIGSPLTIASAVISYLSITQEWGNSYSYYLESVNDNNRISKEYNEIAKYTPTKIEEFRFRKELIDLKNDNRNSGDLKYPLTSRENRKGMKYSLRNFQRSCRGCKQIPIDMESTECGVCGKF